MRRLFLFLGHLSFGSAVHPHLISNEIFDSMPFIMQLLILLSLFKIKLLVKNASLMCITMSIDSVILQLFHIAFQEIVLNGFKLNIMLPLFYTWIKHKFCLAFKVLFKGTGTRNTDLVAFRLR